MPLHPLIEEWDAGLRGGDPLGFPGYEPPERESVVTGRTAHYVVIEGDFSVLGGSMGAAHGEKVVRAFDRACELGLPVVSITASGGARMQEGMVSLIQMARTAAAAQRHHAAGLLSLAVHRSPTTGGVHASYGALADLRAVVAGATIGFAGPRVVELVLGEALPPGSHTAESAYDAGLVDAIVEPGDGERAWIESALGLRDEPVPSRPSRSAADGGGSDATAEPGTPFAHVLAARAPDRATPYDLLAVLATAWTPMRPEPGCDAGLATVSGRRVVAVALNGSPGPAAYRLAQRAIALAGRLGLPLLTVVDTPGADPSAPAEADGIAREIARTFAAMADLPTASVSVCTGEGGSGGALAVSAADQLLLLDGAYFSVISPEGAAAILDRDAGQAAARAAQLRLLPDDLLELGIVDCVTTEARLGDAVGAALDVARPGQRRARFDEATARWLRS